MQKRLLKLEEAKNLIYTKIICAAANQYSLPRRKELVEVFIMVQDQNVLIIGNKNRHLMKELNSRKLEDMLNALQQFSFIQSYERVCGDVFKVIILLPLKSESSVIPISHYKKTKFKRA